VLPLLDGFGLTAGASIVMLSAMTIAVSAAHLRIGVTSLRRLFAPSQFIYGWSREQLLLEAVP
jgi:hypothetical protein